MDPIYRKAIVTGASREIGEATVRALREQGLAVLAVSGGSDFHRRS